MILDVRGLSIQFGSEKVVNDISFTVQRGSFTAIVGESGSGKSVSALSLLKLLPDASIKGSARFRSKPGEEVDLSLLSTPQLQSIRGCQISYVFQNPGTSLNPVMRIESQLAEAYRIHFKCTDSELRANLVRALQDVQLQDTERILKAFPHELSGGMKQRIMIAMACITNPSLLIADEPTTALDLKTEHEIMSLLLRLRTQKGLSILFITHDLRLAQRYADSIYVFQAGRVVERLDRGTQLTPKEIYTKRLFAAKLMDSTPKQEIRLP